MKYLMLSFTTVCFLLSTSFSAITQVQESGLGSGPCGLGANGGGDSPVSCFTNIACLNVAGCSPVLVVLPPDPDFPDAPVSTLNSCNCFGQTTSEAGPCCDQVVIGWAFEVPQFEVVLIGVCRPAIVDCDAGECTSVSVIGSSYEGFRSTCL